MIYEYYNVEIMNNELKSTQNHYKYMYLHNTDI